MLGIKVVRQYTYPRIRLKLEIPLRIVDMSVLVEHFRAISRPPFPNYRDWSVEWARNKRSKLNGRFDRPLNTTTIAY